MKVQAEASIFGDAVKLGERVAVYIPSTVEATQEVDSTEMVNEAMTVLSDLFGGATSTEAVGGWVSDKHGLITEGVTVVYAFSDKLTPENLKAVRDFADRVKNEMKQEAVSVEINNSLYLV